MALSDTRFTYRRRFSTQTLKSSPTFCLYFNDIFYLNFRKELLIITEANFSHLLHFPFFIVFRKKMCFSKILPSPLLPFCHQSLRSNFNLNQNWRKIGIPLCQDWAFFRAKMDISWFHHISSFAKTSFLYNFKVLNKTFNLILHLLKSYN